MWTKAEEERGRGRVRGRREGRGEGERARTDRKGVERGRHAKTAK